MDLKPLSKKAEAAKDPKRGKAKDAETKKGNRSNERKNEVWDESCAIAYLHITRPTPFQGNTVIESPITLSYRSKEQCQKKPSPPHRKSPAIIITRYC